MNGEQNYKARVSFDVYGLTGDDVEGLLNGLIDKLASVDTGELSWDNVEWSIEEVSECCEHEYESGCACCIGECENCSTTDPMEMTDAQADADTLASAGWGTDEDYGYYGD